MSSHEHRPSSETLPAIRPTSPLLKGTSKPLHEAIALPPIQSLTREYSSPLPGVHSRESPPDQPASIYQRKRAGIPGDASPSGTNKRRRVDSEEPGGSNSPYNEPPPPPQTHPISTSLIPESHIRRQLKQPATNDHEEPTTPTQQSLRYRAPEQGHTRTHSRHSSASGSITNISSLTAHPAQTKQEQASPPSVVVQSPATPANTSNAANTSTPAWPSEPSASFSRRISNASSSSHRSTSRKGPPSRLNFQTHSHRSSSSLDAQNSIAPSIRSAPPVPVPGGLVPQQPPPSSLAGTSAWLTNRPSIQPRPRHGNNLSSDMSTPRATAASNSTNNAREAWPSVPTPTSLRLGARSIVQPSSSSNQIGNGNVGHVNSPSARQPVTPAVPSPIPNLGSGSGLQDKAKFMQKMSDMYDKASGHKACITAEEVDKRIRDAIVPKEHEILVLKNQLAELQKLLRQQPNRNSNAGVGSSKSRGPSSSTVDEDGDVAMANSNPTLNSNSGPLPIRSAVPPASNGDRASIPRASPHPGEPNKEGGASRANTSEEVASARLPTPPAIPNGIASHSPAAAPT